MVTYFEEKLDCSTFQQSLCLYFILSILLSRATSIIVVSQLGDPGVVCGVQSGQTSEFHWTEPGRQETADIKRSLGHVAARSQVGAGQSPILRADIMPQAGLWEIGFDRRDQSSNVKSVNTELVRLALQDVHISLWLRLACYSMHRVQVEEELQGEGATLSALCSFVTFSPT